MKTGDRYLAVHNLDLLQRQAGVDQTIAELVKAWARLATDRGEQLCFEPPPFAPASGEALWLSDLCGRNPHADQRVLRFLAAYAGDLHRRGLPVLFDVPHLCRTVGMNAVTLRWLLANTRRQYRVRSIPKRAGGSRHLYIPRRLLRSLQIWILRQILDHVAPEPSANAFVAGRSTVSTARPHVRRRVIVRLDLKDFFSSIARARIRGVFQKVGYPYSVAAALSGLCTVDGFLPQGAATSPALSNLVAGRLDRRLVGLSRHGRFSYTRYADDLIFSSDDPDLPRLIPLLKRVIAQEGFEVNHSKTVIMRSGGQQRVTGIITNTKLGLPRQHVRCLRAALHRMQTSGPASVWWRKTDRQADAAQVIAGHLAYLRMVDPETHARLTSQSHVPGTT